MRTCETCGGTYNNSFFKSICIYTCGKDHIYHYPICLGCYGIRAKKYKQNERLLQKAQNTYYHHANKLLATGIIQKKEELDTIYGWDSHQMAHDIKNCFENGCPYCGRQYSIIEGGLHNISLDIIDPALPPNYETNVHWICLDCNKRKRNSSSEAWELKLQDWKLWRETQKLLEQNPYYYGLPLFENISEDLEGSKICKLEV